MLAVVPARRQPHRNAYLDIAGVAVVIPIIALIVLITVGTVLGSF